MIIFVVGRRSFSLAITEVQLEEEKWEASVEFREEIG